jgi:prophage antirepressor-like protein/predicted GIY-YIG superfamily endonuclease/DNA-directed RNA polymerase subunit RPC12/RpoP
MESVIEKYNIRKCQNLFNLNDIVNNLIESKSPATYMNKIQDKKKIKLHYYITETQFITILSKSNKKMCKDALEDINNISLNDETQLVIPDNQLSFEGTNFFYFKDDNNEIWFKGRDVAKILGYKDTKDAIQQHIDKEDKIPYKDLVAVPNTPQKGITNTEGSNLNIKPNTIFINESGLYSIMMTSKLPKAKEFKRWITKEVIPTIRKTGSYSLINKPDVKLLPDLNEFENKNCFYLLNIKDNQYKFGISQNIKDRISSHKRSHNFKELVKVWNMDSFEFVKKLEKKVKDIIKQWNIQYNEENQLEWFQTNEMCTLDDIINKINEYIETIVCENKNDNNQLEIQKEITKQKEIENKTKEIEMISNLLTSYKGPLLDNILSNYFKINNNQLSDSINNKIKNNLIDTESDNEEINSYCSESENSEEESDNEENRCLDCSKEINKTSIRCGQCASKKRFFDASKDRPSYEQLKEDLKKSNYTKVGEKYNVSDNTIRKWMRKYEKYNNL